MRLAVGLLTCLSVATLGVALADPPATSTASTPAASSDSSTPAAASTPASTAAPAPAAKPAVDMDTQHFLSMGYKPQMRDGQEVYCKTTIDTGSRLPQKTKTCGTIEELKLMEEQVKAGVEQGQRQQTLGPSSK